MTARRPDPCDRPPGCGARDPDRPGIPPDGIAGRMARLFAENGFKPVFFNEGLLGSPAWE